MRVVNIMLEDAEHERMMKQKGKLTWGQLLKYGAEAHESEMSESEDTVLEESSKQ